LMSSNRFWDADVRLGMLWGNSTLLTPAWRSRCALACIWYVLTGAVVPAISLNYDYLLLVVAVLGIGTTISPYLFFWQASQEVEEMRRERARPRLPLKILSRGGGGELTRISIDTTIGMVFSNLIAFFIVLATASTLHAHGLTYIETAAQAAEALRPIAGDFAFLLFALGIVGAGLLAVPVLAGSAAYAVAELFGWPSTLEAKFPEAVGFYVIILAAKICMSKTPNAGPR
jgi:Mn2+/Fe2+ NRAMP family transporter